MILIYFIILVIIALIMLSFLFSSRVVLELNSERSDMQITMLWLKPFIKACVTRREGKTILQVSLFNQRVINKELRNKGKGKNINGIDLVRLSEPSDVHVDIHYGFKDPYITGIACGAINVASEFVNIDSFEQTPDFMSSGDYVNLDASGKVNIGSTLIRLYKLKSNY